MKKLLSVLAIILLTAVVSIFGTLFVLGMVDNEDDMKASDNTEVINSADGEKEEILSGKAEIEEKEPLTTPDVESEPEPEVEVEVQPKEPDKSEEPKIDNWCVDKSPLFPILIDILPEEMPTHIRPSGYDNPVLSDGVAFALLMEAHEGAELLREFGALSNLRVMLQPENSVEGMPEGEHRVYFAPAFSTEEKFDEYYTKIYTEATVKRVKELFEVKELGGRLTGAHFHDVGSGFINWNLTKFVSLEQVENTATLTVFMYDDFELQPWGEESFTFKYSEEYGWRFEMSEFFEL